MKRYKETRRVSNPGEPDNLITLFWEQEKEGEDLDAVGFYARPIFSGNIDISGGMLRDTYSITRQEDGSFAWESPPDKGIAAGYEEALEKMPALLVEPEHWETVHLVEDRGDSHMDI